VPSHGRPRARNPRKVAGSEAAFQDEVLGLARFYRWRGYHTHDSRRSTAGFPDLVLVKAPRLIFAELKTDAAAPRVTIAQAGERPAWLAHRDVTDEQAEWLAELRQVSDALDRQLLQAAGELTAPLYAPARLEVYIWRPADLELIAHTLAGDDSNADTGIQWARSRRPDPQEDTPQ
jgi:hypothetical protein